MKLTVKSLKQVPYEIDGVEETSTVLDIKKKLEEVHGFDQQTIKLVFNGHMIEDSQTLKDLEIVDGCIVIMMSVKAKPKNVEKAKVEESKQEEKVEKEVEKEVKKEEPKIVQPKPEADYSKEIKSMVEEMGFPREESTVAIKAAKGNLSLAIEFMYNGIPDNLPNLEEGGQSSSGGGMANPIKKIASMIKVMCQGNPSNLQNILLALQQSSPEILDMIRENEDEFKSLVSQPITEEDMRTFQEFNQGMQGQVPGQMQGQGQAQGHGGGGRTGTGGRGQNTIRLTQEEFEAVNRLKAFGFTEMEAVQAYLACDKNEEYALNLLFDNKEKDFQVQVDSNSVK